MKTQAVDCPAVYVKDGNHVVPLYFQFFVSKFVKA